MTGFQLTALAEADLTEIVDYVADASSPTRAEGLRRDLWEAIVRLAEMPGLGHAREDLTHQHVLFWPVHSFLIVYQPETRPLRIVRVLSGWRDIASELQAEP